MPIGEATKKPQLPEGATAHSLYGGGVQLVFNPNSPKYRYTVTDMAHSRAGDAVRGVTTVLRDVIHKPDLMMWAMNMSHGKLFGATWDNEQEKMVYNESKALIKTDHLYPADALQEFMEAGAKAHRDRSDRGKDIGTMVHKAVEMYLLGKDRIESLQEGINEGGGVLSKEDGKALSSALDAFIGWWDALPNKEVLSTERVVYSRSLNYAGTCDIVAKINGKVYMLDIKTTNASRVAPLGIYAEYFMQLGAYSYALREEEGQAFDDLGIIRVGKDGKLCIATATDMNIEVDACERAFAFAVRMHDWLEDTSKWLKDSHFTSHLSNLAEGRELDSTTN